MKIWRSLENPSTFDKDNFIKFLRELHLKSFIERVHKNKDLQKCEGEVLPPKFDEKNLKGSLEK